MSQISAYREVKFGLAFPTFPEVMISVVVLVIGVPIVYLLSKALRLRPRPLVIADARKEATLVSVVVISVFVAISALNIFWYPIIMSEFHKLQRLSVDVIDVLGIAFSRFIVLLPVIVAMKGTGQDLESIGINGKDVGRMFALGFMLSAIYLAVSGFLAPSLGGGFTGFSFSLAYGLVYHAIGGFGEEIVWRGYVQTRLVAYGGTLKGLLATSLLFALWHFPMCYFQFSGVVLEALASAIMRLPIGLLFGYIMLRSKNIIPSSIFHLLSNWNALLWQIPPI